MLFVKVNDIPGQPTLAFFVILISLVKLKKSKERFTGSVYMMMIMLVGMMKIMIVMALKKKKARRRKVWECGVGDVTDVSAPLQYSRLCKDVLFALFIFGFFVFKFTSLLCVFLRLLDSYRLIF